ncbi:hypothetical protein K501DRAFT_283998 [Backusella circina FSU 941]|nr:hypothetical protein K501DRAFT_283998 [Backusella circina FSU 941]
MEPSTSDSVNTSSNRISPRIVRSNWLVFSWNQISRASRALLIISLSLVLIQVIASVISLVIGKNESCEKPLQMYLIIHVARVALTVPFLIYHYLFKGRRRRRQPSPPPQQQQQQPNQEEATGADSAITEAQEEHDAETADTNSNNNSGQQPQQPQQQTTSLIGGWTERFKSILDLFGILWFIVGNYLLFSASSCSVQAPILYYTILAWVLLGYLIILIPVLLCASVIFCLPLVLVAMRAFNINVSNVMVGGSKEEIAALPIFKFKGDENGITPLPSSHNSEQKPEEIKKKKKIGFVNIFKRRQQKQQTDVLEDGKEYESISMRSEDAVCAICLSEYENNELICKLWCEHHYHKDCVQEWLELNSKCPLCKRDFRGKDHHDSDMETEQEEE